MPKLPENVNDRPNTYPLLLIDAGNSRVKWEFREKDGAPSVKHHFPTEALHAIAKGVVQAPDAPNIGANAPDASQTKTSDTVDADYLTTLRVWQRLPSPRSIWISNVAGASVATTLSAWLARQWPLVLRHTIRAMASQCGVTNRYQQPERLGSDRWAGMIGVRATYANEAVLIATLGTATTLDAMDADGHFVGGLIAPGWSLMMRALGEHTAQLPILSLGEAVAAAPQLALSIPSTTPPTFFAQTTRDGIVEGCKLAQVGLITQAWHQWQDTLGVPVRCILAGGAASEIGPALSIPYTRNNNLVLDGLARIATQASGD